MNCPECKDTYDKYAHLEEFSNGVANYKHVYSQATAAERLEGLKAFWNYRRTLKEIADMYGFRLSRTAAAFCALSPNNDYVKNLRSTVTVLDSLNKGIEPEKTTVSTYGQCKLRAFAYASGEKNFLRVTDGDKTLNFYRNLMKPSDPHPVTIDGHMVSVWNLERMTMKIAVRHSFKYSMLALGMRVAAEELDLLPNQLQSTLWFTWKRIHRVYYSGQIDIHSKGAFQTYFPAYLIKPFPFKEPKEIKSADSTIQTQLYFDFKKVRKAQNGKA